MADDNQRQDSRGDAARQVRERELLSAYSTHDLAVTAKLISDIYKRDWFGGIFQKSEEPFMVRLLIGMFVAFREGLLTSKRQALGYMNAVDGRTSQRYIGLAESHGLVTVVQAPTDKRRDLLVPTESFHRLMAVELATLTDGLVLANAALDVRRKSESSELKLLEDHGWDVWNKFLDPTVLGRAGEVVHDVRVEGRSWPRHVIHQLGIETAGFDLAAGISVDRFTDTVALVPDNAAAYIRRAQAHMIGGKVEEAVADLTRALEIEGPRADLYCLRAEAYCQMKAYENAIADYSKSLEIQVDSVTVLLQRGAAYEHSPAGADSAVADYSRVIEIGEERDRMTALIRRAQLFKEIGDEEKASADDETLHKMLEEINQRDARRANEPSGEDRLRSALLKTHRQYPREIFSIAAALVRSHDNSNLLRIQLGIALASNGSLDAAIEQFETVTKLGAEDDTHTALANQLLKVALDEKGKQANRPT